jgi:hypothetical protein
VHYLAAKHHYLQQKKKSIIVEGNYSRCSSSEKKDVKLLSVIQQHLKQLDGKWCSLKNLHEPVGQERPLNL